MGAACELQRLTLHLARCDVLVKRENLPQHLRRDAVHEPSSWGTPGMRVRPKRLSLAPARQEPLLAEAAAGSSVQAPSVGCYNIG